MSTTGQQRLDVVDVPDDERYELRDGKQVLAFVAYRRRPGLIAFIHTEVDEAHEGEGLGGTLIRAVLDAARTDGSAVLPFCPFVNGWIQRHPDYLDLVPAGSRAHFGL